MNKLIFKVVVFFIGSLPLHAQDLETVLKADTIYVNVNKGFSVYQDKSKKSVHLPCYRYFYFNSEIQEGLSFYTCKWLDEDPPEIKVVDSEFLNDAVTIDLDFIKSVDFKIVSRKFRGKVFYVLKKMECNKIEVTEAKFGSSYEGSVNDYKIIYEEKK